MGFAITTPGTEGETEAWAGRGTVMGQHYSGPEHLRVYIGLLLASL